MFYFPGSLSLEVNLLGAAMACRFASEATSLDSVPPLDSNLGPFAPAMRVSPVERQRLPMLAWRRDERLIIAIAGLRTSWEAIAFFAGSQNPTSANGCLGRVNALVSQYAINVVADVLNSSLRSATKVSVVGHSGGGCVAHVVAASLRSRMPTMTTNVASYGAPRFADDVFENHNGNLMEARVMNYADSFPVLIPWVQESPLFAVLSTPMGNSNINRLSQGQGGVGINADGNLVESIRPFGITSNPTYEFFISRVGANLLGNNPHSIVNYEAALLRRSVALPPTPLRGPSVDTSSEAAPARLPVQELISLVEQAQAAQAVPFTSRVPATPSVVKTRHRNGWWQVSVLGEVVYSTRSRLDAKGVSRALRLAYIQYWQRPWQFSSPAALGNALFGQLDLSRPPVPA